MMMRMLNSLRGSLRIKITGAATERFLNLCAARGVAFWDMKKTDIDTVYASVRIEGFFAMHKYAGRCMCKIAVDKKRGVPFALRKYGRRYALWGGVLLCAAFILAMSRFVWTIEINGCEKTNQFMVLALLEKNGLKTGTYGKALDSNEIRNSILEECGEIISLSINIKGSHAVVEVRERKEKPMLIQQDEPCDVISDKTGLITGLRVREGTAPFVIGQTVQKGDVLSQGTIVSKTGEISYVHASAQADVRTWSSFDAFLSNKLYSIEPTGKKVTQRSIILGNRRIKLYFVESMPFACYYKTIEKDIVSVADDMRFPIALITETYIECEKRQITVDDAKCMELLREKMLERWAIANPTAVLENSEYSAQRVEGGYSGKLKITAIEKAGVIAPLTEANNNGTDN